MSYLAIVGGLVLCACALRDMRRVLGPTHDTTATPYLLERV